jgi:hypothetical protein
LGNQRFEKPRYLFLRSRREEMKLESQSQCCGGPMHPTSKIQEGKNTGTFSDLKIEKPYRAPSTISEK